MIRVGRQATLVSLEFRVCFSNCGVDDGEKLVGHKARSADKDSIDAVLTKKRSRISRFDAATVLNRYLLCPGLANDLAELVSDKQVRIVRLLRILMGQRTAKGIPDRPHRLVRNAQPGQGLWRNVR